MPKYTEAFFNITHKPVTIMQIRNEYNLDHTVYERRYKGHIFCPYCKAVPLTVVHSFIIADTHTKNTAKDACTH